MTTFPKVSLPSGRRVLLTRKADPRRPWELSGRNGIYEVVRPRRGDSSRLEHFAADRTEPLQFDQADAEALLAVMNANL